MRTLLILGMLTLMSSIFVMDYNGPTGLLMFVVGEVMLAAGILLSQREIKSTSPYGPPDVIRYRKQ